jgi:hypothetical protein
MHELAILSLKNVHWVKDLELLPKEPDIFTYSPSRPCLIIITQHQAHTLSSNTNGATKPINTALPRGIPLALPQNHRGGNDNNK